MSAIEPLCYLFGVKSSQFSKHEKILLEGFLFIYIYEELKEIFRARHLGYLKLMKLNIEKENRMLEKKLLPFIVKDILETEEYTLEGIARYTQTPEDLLQEILISENIKPSVLFLRRLMELHRTVKPEVYRVITQKFISKFLAVA